MQTRVRRYQISDLEKLNKLLDDALYKDMIMRCIDKYPNNAFVEEKHEDIVAVLVHNANISQEWCDIYFYFSDLSTDILSKLLAEIKFQKYHEIKIMTHANDKLSKFIENNKFKYNVTDDCIVHRMVYSKDKFLETANKVQFVPYREELYDKCKKYAEDVYYDMRKQYDHKPYKIYPAGLKTKSYIKDFFVCLDKENIISSVYAGDGIIEYIAVNRNYRHKGYAKAAVGFGANKLLEEGYNEIMLEVDEHNLPAIKLYEFLGFKIKDTVRYFYF